jgi:hypothetical protein
VLHDFELGGHHQETLSSAFEDGPFKPSGDAARDLEKVRKQTKNC